MTSQTTGGLPMEAISKAILVDRVKTALLAADPERYADARRLVVESWGERVIPSFCGRRMDVTCDSPLGLLADIHKLMS